MVVSLVVACGHKPTTEPTPTPTPDPRPAARADVEIAADGTVRIAGEVVAAEQVLDRLFAIRAEREASAPPDAGPAFGSGWSGPPVAFGWRSEPKPYSFSLAVDRAGRIGPLMELLERRMLDFSYAPLPFHFGEPPDDLFGEAEPLQVTLGLIGVEIGEPDGAVMLPWPVDRDALARAFDDGLDHVSIRMRPTITVAQLEDLLEVLGAHGARALTLAYGKNALAAPMSELVAIDRGVPDASKWAITVTRCYNKGLADDLERARSGSLTLRYAADGALVSAQLEGVGDVAAACLAEEAKKVKPHPGAPETVTVPLTFRIETN